VGVTIFEASSGGLFIPAEAGVRPGNFITLPNQAVDHDGNISVPYAGTIRAKGRTPTEVQKALVELRVVSRSWLKIICGAVSGTMKLSDHAARSTG
jgi:hypothetical protein